MHLAFGDALSALPYPVYRIRLHTIISELIALYQSELPSEAVVLGRRTAALFGPGDAVDTEAIDAVDQAWDDLYDAEFDRYVPYEARSLCGSLRYAKSDLTASSHLVAAFICGVVGGWKTRLMSPAEPYADWIMRMETPADPASGEYQQLIRLTNIARYGRPDGPAAAADIGSSSSRV
jgi:hypothetical protein